MTSSITTVHSVMRDLYPSPGERIKQWVIAARALDAWASETCPRMVAKPHLDNTGVDCCNLGSVAWMDVVWNHACHICEDAGQEIALRPDVVAWLAEWVRRNDAMVAIDKTLLPDLSLGDNLLLNLIKTCDVKP